MKNTWDKNRNKNGWSGGLADWTEGETAFVSVVFSWLVQSAYQRAQWYKTQGYRVRVGGPAAMLQPRYFTEFDGGEVNALHYHNPQATFTTRGCIRNCKFCGVPKFEGAFRELDDWESKPIICDNNFLASSRKHFDRAIDRLKPVEGVDFNQGLDARLLTDYHAGRLAELDMLCVRLAWDHSKIEAQFRKAFDTLIGAGFPASKIRVYVIIGFDDDPQDALYRLETVKGLGAYPNPMRYQPLNSTRRNEYVHPNWSDSELTRYMRYWANLRITRRVPFAEFRNRGDEPMRVSAEQLALE